MKEVAIGIDIGATYTKYGIVDREGKSLAEDLISTTAHKDVEPYMESLHVALNKLIGSVHAKTPIEIKGVGVGAPNGNFYKGTIEYAPNLSWKGLVPFVELFRKHMDVPTVLTNDANAAAIGEMVYGNAKGMEDFIVITLGTGLGSGIVVNGKLVYGHDGFAGEMGHVTVDLNGRLCGCGRRGCLETYASATGIKRTVFELMADATAETEFRNISYHDLNAAMISKAAMKGDPVALKAFDITGKILGQKLADAVALNSPEAIILFGGLANAGDLIFEPTKKYMEEHLLAVFKDKVKILPSGLKEQNAAVTGASALVWKEIEKI
ncbi:MAG: ROK family protein [Candidatus Cyclobacteriaceae bacterium M3_2C_046]